MLFRSDPLGQVGVEEPMEIGCGPFGAAAHEIAEHAEVGTVQIHRRAVRLDPTDLGLGERMPTHLQRDDDLVEPTAQERIGEHGGGGPGVMRVDRPRIQARTTPEMGRDRPQHDHLLIGRTAVHIDGADEGPDQVVHRGIGHSEGHGRAGYARACPTLPPSLTAMTTRTRTHSVSGCNEYDRCPRRYRYGYLDRAPHDRPTPAAWRHGIAVHAALEAAYRDRMLGRPLADTVPEALTALGEAWTAEGLPEDPAWIRHRGQIGRAHV